jgi:hypothetical protein
MLVWDHLCTVANSPFFCEYFPINSISFGRIASVEW